MPKSETQTMKVLRREDYVYATNQPKRPLSNVANDPLNAIENGFSSAGASVTVNDMRAESGFESISDVEGLASDRNQIHFPRADADRREYRTRTGKKVTKYQWDVYDFILKIPEGKVTTYKVISQSVGGSARSVGGALRINPFAPYVPCHRVIASNLFIGGFFGQWAGRTSSNKSKQARMEGQPEIGWKIKLLKEEGLSVDNRGFLEDQENVVWKPGQTDF